MNKDELVSRRELKEYSMIKEQFDEISNSVGILINKNTPNANLMDMDKYYIKPLFNIEMEDRCDDTFKLTIRMCIVDSIDGYIVYSGIINTTNISDLYNSIRNEYDIDYDKIELLLSGDATIIIYDNTQYIVDSILDGIITMHCDSHSGVRMRLDSVLYKLVDVL